MLRSLLIAFSLALPLTAHGVTFKIATVAPDGSAWMEAMKAGASEVERRTEGRVRFRFYPGGIMGSDKSVLRKMRVGQLHGGGLTGGSLSLIYPDASIYGLPFAFRSYEEVDYVRERMDRLIIEGLEKQGYVGLGLTENGFAYLMSTTPARSIEELKERKVWIPEGDQIGYTALETIGVSPVSLPLTDVLTGLQTGLVDTVSGSPVGAIALQWHTRVRYITDAPLLYLFGTLLLDKQHFDRLSPIDQKAVREVMGEVSARLDKENRQSNREALEALAGQGIELLKPHDDGDSWRAGVTHAVEALSERGVFSAGMLKTLQDYLRQYRTVHAAH